MFWVFKLSFVVDILAFFDLATFWAILWKIWRIFLLIVWSLWWHYMKRRMWNYVYNMTSMDWTHLALKDM